MKEYFSTAVALKQLDFSNTILHTDILKVYKATLCEDCCIVYISKMR